MKNSAKLLIKKTLLIILITFPIISVIIYIALKVGFSFESIHINNIQINKLSVKLNKKLDVIVDKVIVKGSRGSKNKKASNLTEDDITTIKRFFFFSYFIDKLTVNSILIDENELSLTLLKNRLKIDSDIGNAEIFVGWNEPRVSLILNNAKYNEKNVSLSGNGIFNLLENSYSGQIFVTSEFGKTSFNINGDLNNIALFFYDTDIKYQHYDFKSDNTKINIDLENYDINFSTSALTMGAKGEASGTLSGNLLTVKVVDSFSQSIEKIIEAIPLDEEIKEWIYKRPISSEYFLRELRLKVDLERELFDLNYFYLDGVFGNIETTFNDELPPLKTKLASIKIEDGVINIDDGGESRYRDNEVKVDLNIDSIAKKGTLLKINIDTKEPLSKDFFEIPSYYGVDFDIEQINGKSDTSITLTIGLDKSYFDIDFKTKIKDSTVLVEGYPLKFKYINGKKRGEKVFINSQFKTDLREDITLVLNGNYNQDENNIVSEVLLREFKSFDGAVLDIKDKNVDLTVDWKDGLRATSKDLSSSFIANNGKFFMQFNKFNHLEKDSFLLKEFLIHDGNLTLNGDSQKIEIDINAQSKGSFLSSNGVPLTEMDISFLREKEKIQVDLNKNINLNWDDNSTEVFINDIDLNGTQLYNFYKKLPKDSDKSFRKYSINGYNSNLIHKKNQINSDWYSITVEGENASLDLKKDKSKFFIKKDGDELTIRGKNIDSKFTSDLADIKVLGDDGYWNIIGFGNLKNKEVYGVIKIKDMMVKEASGIMNIIALLNTVPALIQFKSPGFTSDGYEIKNGLIDFYLGQDKLFFKAIRLVGVNTDIIGQGSIDLKTKKLDLVLSVNTIKGLSNIIGNIPIIGYILLDKEKTIGTVVKVEGTLDKPKIKSNVAEDVLLYPIQVVKRILLLPSYLFGGSDDLEEKEFSK